ncbi:MAG: PorV/PorQ family protein [Fibrobacter sp.]|nr:PorV/PorQ family protein [Fibrobacter sp.]
MKKTLLFLICLAAVCTEAGVGESSVITLIFPFGARSCGMGETGTALADDESALFFNPAGLAIQNRRWQGGALSQSYGPILPELKQLDLWHLTFSSCYQPSNVNIGGFGAFWNYINMGENTITDHLGNIRDIVNSWEAVWAMGWGFNFKEFGDTSHNYGVTFKYLFSALAPGYGPNGEGTASGFCFDLGYLYISRFGLRFGFTLMNMGPNVFYVDHDNPDPLPFTVNLAAGYKKQILKRLVDLACELRLDKELVVNNGDKPEPFWKAMHTDWGDENASYEFQDINIHLGWEVGLMNTGFYRCGLMLDFAGERYEFTQGFGINIMDHLRCDFYYIHAPIYYMRDFAQRFKRESVGATGVRHRQWRLSFTLTGLANWSENNRQWWKTSE